jgi:hypothetical protein
LLRQINDGQIVAFQRKIGNLPMMVGSTKCVVLLGLCNAR